MEEVKRKRRVTLPTITICISTMLVLMLLGGTLLTVLTAGNLTRYAKESIHFTIMLDDGTSDTEATRLMQRLMREPFVKVAEYVSKDQALKEYTQNMGADPQEFLGFNPFQPSIEVKLTAAYANEDSVARIGQRLTQLGDSIGELHYQEDLLKAVNRNLTRAGLVMLALAAVLALTSFALINNAVRLAIYSQRFLIHTMMLVGASRWFVRWPFMRVYLLTGLLAGMLADAILWIGAEALLTRHPSLVDVLTPDMLLIAAVALPVAGLLLTGVSTHRATAKFLRMKAGELYRI